MQTQLLRARLVKAIAHVPLLVCNRNSTVARTDIPLHSADAVTVAATADAADVHDLHGSDLREGMQAQRSGGVSWVGGTSRRDMYGIAKSNAYYGSDLGKEGKHRQVTE